MVVDTLVRELLAGVTSALDVGSGGGEFVRSITNALPPNMAATEGWPANVPVARAALARAFGVELFAYDADVDAVMPFADASFDVLLHESYDADEIARILTPGGAFLTQQVAATTTPSRASGSATSRPAPRRASRRQTAHRFVLIARRPTS